MKGLNYYIQEALLGGKNLRHIKNGKKFGDLKVGDEIYAYHDTPEDEMNWKLTKITSIEGTDFGYAKWLFDVGDENGFRDKHIIVNINDKSNYLRIFCVQDALDDAKKIAEKGSAYIMSHYKPVNDDWRWKTYFIN